MMEMEPQKAERSRKYVHISWPHPSHLPSTAVSHLAHSGGLGHARLGKRCVS